MTIHVNTPPHVYLSNTTPLLNPNTQHCLNPELHTNFPATSYPYHLVFLVNVCLAFQQQLHNIGSALDGCIHERCPIKVLRTSGSTRLLGSNVSVTVGLTLTQTLVENVTQNSSDVYPKLHRWLCVLSEPVPGHFIQFEPDTDPNSAQPQTLTSCWWIRWLSGERSSSSNSFTLCKCMWIHIHGWNCGDTWTIVWI